MAFGSKATDALKAKIEAVEAFAKKEIQTVKDRVTNAEDNLKTIVATDTPAVAVDITKFGTDLAALVTRVEALEASAKVTALKEAAAASAALTKAASKVKAAKKATETAEAVAEPAVPVEATAVEPTEVAPQA
jgi:hypothetical protein